MAASWTAEEHLQRRWGAALSFWLNDKVSDIKIRIWCVLVTT